MIALPLTRPIATFIQPDITKSGLVAQYKFNGNAIDSSGNGYNGTPNNSPTFGGTNVLLNGTNQSIAINATPIQVYPFTINVWVNITTGGFIWSQTLTTDYVGFMVWATSTNLGLHIANGSGTDTVAQISTSITGWNMLTALFTSNVSRTIILNGNFASQITDTTNLTPYYTSDNEIGMIGGYWNTQGFPNWFGGYIDDLRIYNRTLTNAEITQLYNNRAR